ncbi:hypothetical protein PZA11_002385 [Diplocarpon coronariae]|uniref:CENP-V/GFA domain-containing protein n=1 Tax=Diplocarpon coronariae TaxID=2795749 RepID=A0A218ZAN2_9HELO|nr:hypothetical protein JHW43_001475 [Diplocarpon mali]OWP04623.1 hypothetical protein B2J93_4437 [Marssonina coronariae]
MDEHPLHGACFCGRNRYTVCIPQDATEKPRVFFDNSYGHRRSQATPLSAWLRVPLAWYQSTTYAFREDESHASIRRSYTSPNEQSSKRHFCGFCGTPLSFWSERTPGDATYISLTLGSLVGSNLRDLEDLGLLPQEAVEDVATSFVGRGTSKSNINGGEGLPWFETMVKGSRLGNVQTSWGETQSENGRYKVEWEIVEWTDDGAEVDLSPVKRKLGEIEEDETMT